MSSSDDGYDPLKAMVEKTKKRSQKPAASAPIVKATLAKQALPPPPSSKQQAVEKASDNEGDRVTVSAKQQQPHAYDNLSPQEKEIARCRQWMHVEIKRYITPDEAIIKLRNALTHNLESGSYLQDELYRLYRDDRSQWNKFWSVSAADTWDVAENLAEWPYLLFIRTLGVVREHLYGKTTATCLDEVNKALPPIDEAIKALLPLGDLEAIKRWNQHRNDLKKYFDKKSPTNAKRIRSAFLEYDDPEDTKKLQVAVTEILGPCKTHNGDWFKFAEEQHSQTKKSALGLSNWGQMLHIMHTGFLKFRGNNKNPLVYIKSAIELYPKLIDLPNIVFCVCKVDVRELKDIGHAFGPMMEQLRGTTGAEQGVAALSIKGCN